MELKINRRFLNTFLSFFIMSLITIGELAKVKAQDNPPQQQENTLKQPKVHNLNFEDELVEGGVQKPDLFYLIQRKNFNFKKLVRLRENFLPEMRETSDYLREGRSKN